MKIIEGVSILVLVWSCRAAYGAPLCLLGDFDSQVQRLLGRIMLTPQQIHNITSSFHDLQEELRMRWGGAELFYYGSLPGGLGTRTSDVDVFVRIPNFNDSAEAYIVEETIKLFKENPEKYRDVDNLLNGMTYYDISKQRVVDITFKSDSGMQDTKFISYSLNLDKRHFPLIATIKFWAKTHNLAGKTMMPNYAEYVLVIFYLQQKKMIPSVSAMQANLPPLIYSKWDTNLKEIPYSVENNETLYELLGGFFKYYSEFNFKDYCVSPFAGRPIAKKDFKNIDTVPEEFSFYKTNVRSGDYLPLPVDTDICIQDVFIHNSNIGELANLLKFTNHVKYAAKMYDELPSERFLRSILVKDNYSKKEPMSEEFKNVKLKTVSVKCETEIDDMEEE